MRKALTPLIGVLVGLAFLLPVAIGLMQGKVIEIELAKPRTAKEALQQAYTKHFQEKDYQRAIEKYRWIVERFPDSEEAVEAQYRIGNIYQWDLVEPEKAIREYEKLRERYPESEYAIAALIRIGECYGRMKEYEKEIECCRRVIEEYPNSSYVTEAKAVMAGTLLHELYKLDKSKRLYEEILSNFSDTDYADEAKLWLTYISQRKGEITKDEAIKTYRSLVGNKATNYHIQAAAQYMIGYTYCGKREFEKAVIELQKVLDEYPNTYEDLKAETYCLIGHIYEQQKKYDLAEGKYKLGLKLYPKSIWAGDLRKRMERIEEKKQIFTHR